MKSTENPVVLLALAQVESEKRYKDVFDHVSDAIFLIDVGPDGEFRYGGLNPAGERAMGLSSAEVAGRRVEDVLPDALIRDVSAHYRQCAEGGVSFSYAETIDLPAGRRHCRITLVPVRDGGGWVHRIIGIAHDITEREKAEAELRKTQAMFRQLAARYETAMEEAHKHLAREMHEDLAQVLAVIHMKMAVLRVRFCKNNPHMLKHIQHTVELVERCIRMVRQMVDVLRPVVLDMGLVPTLEWLVGQFVESNGIPCELSVCDEEIDLDDGSVMVIFRIVRESLNNIARHAEASRVEVVLSRDGAEYALEIRDDGKGFDLDTPWEQSLGLVGIHEQVRRQGGEVSIFSAPGHGTIVEVRFKQPAQESFDFAGGNRGEKERR